MGNEIKEAPTDTEEETTASCNSVLSSLTTDDQVTGRTCREDALRCLSGNLPESPGWSWDSLLPRDVHNQKRRTRRSTVVHWEWSWNASDISDGTTLQRHAPTTMTQRCKGFAGFLALPTWIEKKFVRSLSASGGKDF